MHGHSSAAPAHYPSPRPIQATWRTSVPHSRWRGLSYGCALGRPREASSIQQQRRETMEKHRRPWWAGTGSAREVDEKRSC